jgi:hypothetical protein
VRGQRLRDTAVPLPCPFTCAIAVAVVVLLGEDNAAKGELSNHAARVEYNVVVVRYPRPVGQFCSSTLDIRAAHQVRAKKEFGSSRRWLFVDAASDRT